MNKAATIICESLDNHPEDWKTEQNKTTFKNEGLGITIEVSALNNDNLLSVFISSLLSLGMAVCFESTVDCPPASGFFGVVGLCGISISLLVFLCTTGTGKIEGGYFEVSLMDKVKLCNACYRLLQWEKTNEADALQDLSRGIETERIEELQERIEKLMRDREAGRDAS